VDDAKWERAAGWGGIVFVVLALASVFLVGSPPMTSDPAREIADFFVDNDDAIRQSAFVGILATIPLVWWGAAMYRTVERATGNARLSVMAAIGIAIGAVASCIASVVYAVVAMLGVTGSGGVTGVKFFYVLGTNMNGVVGIGTALLVGAVSAGILRSGMMARALGWFGALVALVALVGSLISVSGNEAVMAISFVSFLLFMVWILIVSVLMIRRPAEAGAVT